MCMHITLLTLTIALLVATFGPDEKGNIYANTMLDSTIALIGSAMICYFCYTVWFHQSSFLILVQTDILTGPRVPKQKYNVEEKAENYIATMISIINTMCTVYQFFAANLNGKYMTNTVKFWLKMLFILKLVLFNLPGNIFIATTLRLRDRSRLFLNKFISGDIENRAVNQNNNILREYYQLDDFVNQLNNKFGLWVLIHMILGTPYLSQKSVEFFKGSSSFSSVLLSIPVTFAHIFFLFVAASASQKVNQFKLKLNFKFISIFSLCFTVLF